MPRVEIRRPVLAPQVAAADLEEPARRELEVLLRLSFRTGGQHPVDFRAAAVADRRSQRFLDRDDDVGIMSACHAAAGAMRTRRNKPERRSAAAGSRSSAS